MIYTGHYLRVWIPEIEKPHKYRRWCETCKSTHQSLFCQYHGTPTKPIMGTVEAFTLFELFNEVFGDYGRFSEKFAQGDYYIVAANSPEQTAGTWHDCEEIEISSIEETELGPDWAKLEAALTERGARFERALGIVAWEG